MKRNFTILLTFLILEGFAQGFVVDSFISNITISKNGAATVNEKSMLTSQKTKEASSDIYHTSLKMKVLLIKQIFPAYSVTIMNTRSPHPMAIRWSKSKQTQIHFRQTVLRYFLRCGRSFYHFLKAIRSFTGTLPAIDVDATINTAKFNIYLPDDVKIRYNDLVVFNGSEGEKNKDAGIANKMEI